MGITQKDLDKIMKRDVIPKLNEELANLSNSHPKFVIRKKYSRTLVYLQEHLPIWNSLNIESDDLKELKRTNDLLKDAALRIKKDWDKAPIDLFIDKYAAPFRLPQKTILRNTNFELYKTTATSVAHAIWEKRKNMAMYQLFLEMENEDKYVLSQNAISLGPRLAFLEKKLHQPTEKIMRKYQALYHELNGHMEKMTRILVGLKQILDDEPLSYSDLKQQNLGMHLKLLMSSSLFRPLISPFQVLVRNSIAHTSTRFDDIRAEVVLVDRNETVRISYSDFIMQMRELAASAVVISHIDNLVAIETLNFLRSKLLKKGIIN